MVSVGVAAFGEDGGGPWALVRPLIFRPVSLVDVIRGAQAHRVPSFDGIELAVLEWPGDRDTILFVHATGLHKELWAPVVAELRNGGVTATLLAADMRGHGDSQSPESLSWWDYGRDASAIVSSLGGPGLVFGVGHSMGGGAVLGAELIHPGMFDGLVLIDPAIMSEEYLERMSAEHGNPWADGANRRRDRFLDKETALDNFASKEVFAAWVDGVIELYAEFGLRSADDGAVLKCSPTWEATTFSCRDLVELWPQIPEVDCPITLITAELSTTHHTSHAHESAVQMRARHVRLPGIGHFIPMEAPDWVAQEVWRMYSAANP